MELIVTRTALKALEKMPKRDAEALVRKLNIFAIEPFGSHGWAKALTGGGVRVRHGDWRAICQVNGEKMVVVVIRIGNRREVYR
jgi:mRNA interferase RelE/StbE